MADSHDHYENLSKAIEIANSSGCELLLFAGDLIAPGNGSEVLSEFNGEVKFIYGNNDGEEFGMVKNFSKYENLEVVGKTYEAEYNGIKIFMNHYPRIAEIAAESGLFDLVIYGHDHIFLHKERGNTVLLNPGALHPYKTDGASFVVFDTTNKSVEKIEL